MWRVPVQKNFALEAGYFDLGKFGFTATTVPAGTLSGSAQAKNIFWQVAGGAGVIIGSTAHMKGTILTQAAIHVRTGASWNGRALAQTAVTLEANTVTKPN